ncbi:MAG: hypothetical protein VW397_09245, partial [Candidatus Margulisiibacteriota bacterium]
MLLRRVTRLIPSIYLSPWLLSNCEPYSNKPSNHFNKIPLTGKEFRALDVESRNQLIRNQLGVSNQTLPSADDLATLTENVIGKFVLGQSIVFNAKINGQNRVIPLVTEEPSVVAAINNAIKLFNESGGLAAETDPVNLISGQVLILKNGIPFKEIEAKVNSMEAELKTVSVNELEKLQRLVKRGGGYYGNLKLVDLDDEMAALEFQLDVQEAMGANIVSLVAENLGVQLRGSQSNNLNRCQTLGDMLCEVGVLGGGQG